MSRFNHEGHIEEPAPGGFLCSCGVVFTAPPSEPAVTGAYVTDGGSSTFVDKSICGVIPDGAGREND